MPFLRRTTMGIQHVCVFFLPGRKAAGMRKVTDSSPKSCITAQGRREKLVPHLLLSTVTLAGESLPVKRLSHIKSTIELPAQYKHLRAAEPTTNLRITSAQKSIVGWGKKKSDFYTRNTCCCCCGTTGFLLIILMMLCSFCRRNAAIPSSAGEGIGIATVTCNNQSVIL